MKLPFYDLFMIRHKKADKADLMNLLNRISSFWSLVLRRFLSSLSSLSLRQVLWSLGALPSLNSHQALVECSGIVFTYLPPEFCLNTPSQSPNNLN